MQKIKTLAIAAMLLLTAGALVSSQGQKRMANHRMPPPVPVVGILSGTYASSVSAAEVTSGDESNGSIYGWSFSGITKGDLSGFIFLSVNYTLPQYNPNGGIGSPPEIGSTPQESDVIGGSWSKLIFVDGVYQGSVSGRILGGKLIWDADNNRTGFDLKLAGDNGTDAFAGNVGIGSFEGVLDRAYKSPVMSGSLTLNY